ncbi:MAG: regulatory protein RecX [bacterium]
MTIKNQEGAGDELFEAELKAEKYLALRQRTIFEIEKYLLNKNFSRETITKVINILVEKKYLDDSRYVDDYVRTVLPHKPMGKILTKQRLMKRGVPVDIIEKRFAKIFSEKLENRLAKKLADKKLNIINHYPRQKKYEKLARYLNSRGFPAGIIKETLDNVMAK